MDEEEIKRQRRERLKQKIQQKKQQLKASENNETGSNNANINPEDKSTVVSPVEDTQTKEVDIPKTTPTAEEETNKNDNPMDVDISERIEDEKLHDKKEPQLQEFKREALGNQTNTKEVKEKIIVISSLGTFKMVTNTNINNSNANNKTLKRPRLFEEQTEEEEDKGTRNNNTDNKDAKKNNRNKSEPSFTMFENEEDKPGEDNDPLESYMRAVEEEVEQLTQMERQGIRNGNRITGLSNIDRGNESDDENEDGNDYDRRGEDEIDPLEALMRKVKKNDLELVDHSSVQYEPFRKDFYVEAPDIARMTEEEVTAYRIELDNIKIRGVDCPKPIKRWSQCGLPLPCLNVIKDLKFDQPTPIQAQALPAVMSGRDVIGIAKTGSGKTMAFVLPLFRHIKDQRPLEPQDGPIAIIMTPTRELALQIHAECKKIAVLMGFRVACAYGGAPIKDQIADLKRGAEIAVCTPGRLIDLLCANHGRVTNLKRVTYLVLDECDRLFDFGFEQQIMRIIANIRPDSQRLLFSATFPKPVEALARKVLKNPLEITVGVRSVVSSDVFQYVEVIEEDLKFVRLLEILGKWYKEDADQRLLIFVDRQEASEELLRELVRRGYRCLSLHGGKDQQDRDKTLQDFKSGMCQIMIATSVAARGLDVPQLNIVINYDVPNHKEDYVHRVGRTGRAGKKGRSFTFITKEQERFAPAIYHALLASNAQIPSSLKRLHDEFMEKVASGDAQLPSMGFGGRGLDQIEKEREAQMIAAKKSYAEMEGLSSDEEEIEGNEGEEGSAEKDSDKQSQSQPLSQQATVPGRRKANEVRKINLDTLTEEKNNLKPEAIAALQKAKEIASRVNMAAGMALNTTQEVLADLQQRSGGVGSTLYSAEIEINDYPLNARTRVTSQEFHKQITSMYQCVIVVRGNYVAPGKSSKKDERKLHVMLEGTTRQQVEKAKAEVKRVLNESSLMMEDRNLKRF